MPGFALSRRLRFALSQSPSSALAQHSMKPMSDEQAIKSAMEAAPPAVAKNATIMTVNEKGNCAPSEGQATISPASRTIRTPPVRTRCAWMPMRVEWVAGFLARKDPPAGKVGFIYMLRGGTDASNTDPFATKPEPNNNWIETGAHVMFVGVPRT